ASEADSAAAPPGPPPDDEPLWTIPILRTVAQRGEGVEELLAWVERHRAYLRDSGELERRRRARARTRVRDVVDRELRRIVWGRETTGAVLDRGLDGITAGRETPYSVARAILKDVLGES
ncbi:MAG: hypothetical protein D6701_13070, partial [Gemmatimonadetes bacterium]